jgi:hypothetical protein
MDVSPRHLAGVVGLAVVGMGVLSAAIAAAGRGVAIAVAVTAIAVLVASYVWMGLVAVQAGRQRARSLGDEDTSDRARHLRAHLSIVFGMPLVVIAAHPWGMATIAVAFGVMVACQVVFLHALIVAGLILRRRAGTPPPP